MDTGRYTPGRLSHLEPCRNSIANWLVPRIVGFLGRDDYRNRRAARIDPADDPLLVGIGGVVARAHEEREAGERAHAAPSG